MERRANDPLQIVILVLLTLNLALTGSLWLSGADRSESAQESNLELPDYVDEAELNRIASDVIALYNDSDVDGLYELLDPLAQAQLTRTEFGEQLGKVTGWLGQVESATFSHFEKTEYGPNDVYILHYLTRLSGGNFEKGTLKVTAVDRDDHFGLFGFNLFGGTGN